MPVHANKVRKAYMTLSGPTVWVLALWNNANETQSFFPFFYKKKIRTCASCRLQWLHRYYSLEDAYLRKLPSPVNSPVVSLADPMLRYGKQNFFLRHKNFFSVKKLSFVVFHPWGQAASNFDLQTIKCFRIKLRNKKEKKSWVGKIFFRGISLFWLRWNEGCVPWHSNKIRFA